MIYSRETRIALSRLSTIYSNRFSLISSSVARLPPPSSRFLLALELVSFIRFSIFWRLQSRVLFRPIIYLREAAWFELTTAYQVTFNWSWAEYEPSFSFLWDTNPKLSSFHDRVLYCLLRCFFKYHCISRIQIAWNTWCKHYRKHDCVCFIMYVTIQKQDMTWYVRANSDAFYNISGRIEEKWKSQPIEIYETSSPRSKERE